MELTIRKAKLDDALPLTRLLKEMGWFQSIDSVPFETALPRLFHHLELCLGDSSHSLYVAEQGNNQLAGYVSVHWLPYLFLPGPEGFVSELFIREPNRGLGIGTRLLEAVKQEASERDCFRLSLLNGKQRESYQRGFYKHLGWEERDFMANFIYWMPFEEVEAS